MEDLKTVMIEVSCLEPNKGQIEGLPKNPKFIRDKEFEKLKRSVQESPGLLSLRELLVYPLPTAEKRRKRHYVVIAGNMRHRALVDLGEHEIPCKVIPEGTDVEKLKAYAMKDNGEFGKWDYDMLANAYDSKMLDSWGVDISGWIVKEQDFDDAGQELNVDDYDEEMTMKIDMLPEVYDECIRKLAAINNSIEMAVLDVCGYNQQGDGY